MAERMVADFHVHYNKPEDIPTVIKSAREAGISVLGLIRRVTYLDDFSERVKSLSEGITVLPGVEFIANVNGGRTDLIALGFDSNDPTVRELLGHEHHKATNIKLAARQKEFLEREGYSLENISQEQKADLGKILAGEVDEKAINFCRFAVSDPTNQERIRNLKAEKADVWQKVVEYFGPKKYYIEHPDHLIAKFLWSVYFDIDKRGYIPTQNKLPEIIRAVNKSRGVVLYSPESPERPWNRAIYDKLVTLGIDGVYAWHGDVLDIPLNELKQIRFTGRLILGGSDYDPAINDWKIGSGKGDLYISRRRYQELMDYQETILPNKPV